MRTQIITLLLLALLFGCTQRVTEEERISTAAKNVNILEPIAIEGLDRQRTIRLYLPEDYETSTDHYPVIYAHDGQNLFDDTTSYVGEWGIDESLNQLAKETGFKVIVVGIDHGNEKRLNELSPWENKKYGPAEGESYMTFIAEQLKPLIDSLYRTRPGREHTAIMGSSMGGLISHYAIHQYPEVFGKAIIFSPSYWYAEDVWTFTKDHPLPSDTRVWLEIGAQEGESVEHTKKMFETILATGHPSDNIRNTVDPEGEHNEASWGRQFVPALKWLFEIKD